MRDILDRTSPSTAGARWEFARREFIRARTTSSRNLKAAEHAEREVRVLEQLVSNSTREEIIDRLEGVRAERAEKPWDRRVVAEIIFLEKALRAMKDRRQPQGREGVVRAVICAALPEVLMARLGRDAAADLMREAASLPRVASQVRPDEDVAEIVEDMIGHAEAKARQGRGDEDLE